MLQSFGFSGNIGSLTGEIIRELRKVEGRHPYRSYTAYRPKIPVFWPVFIGFADETDPNSVYRVEPGEFGERLPGVEFVGIDIEKTDEPVTEGVLLRYLPWLVKKYEAGFDRRPAGDETLAVDHPLRWQLNYNTFFFSGSR